MCVWGAILIMCCCGLGSSPLSVSPSFFLSPSVSLSLCSAWWRPSSSLFPLSVVPVTTLPAVNRRGDGQRRIKRRRESNSNWLHIGHVIFIPPSPSLSLSVSYFLFIPPYLSLLPFLNIPPSPFTFMSCFFILSSPLPSSFLLCLLSWVFSTYPSVICLRVSLYFFIYFSLPKICSVPFTPHLYLLLSSLDFLSPLPPFIFSDPLPLSLSLYSLSSAPSLCCCSMSSPVLSCIGQSYCTFVPIVIPGCSGLSLVSVQIFRKHFLSKLASGSKH